MTKSLSSRNRIMAYPTPRLFENGKMDSAFSNYDDVEEFKKVKEVYALFNESDKIYVYNHEGAHEVMGDKSFDWLDHWLDHKNKLNTIHKK